MTYGEKLIQLRKNANMTQADLGERLGVTAQAVSKWEHDVSEPDLGTLRKISAIFGISVDDFLDADKEVSPVVPINPADVAAEMAPVVAQTVSEGVCDNIAAGVRTAVAEANDAVLGCCFDCGRVVKESNKGIVTPKVLCAECYQKRLAAKKARIAAEKAKAEAERRADESKQQGLVYSLRTKRNRCLFWGIFAAVVAVTAGVIAALKTQTDVGNIVGIIAASVWAGYALLGVICEVFLSDSAVADVMEWCLTRSISWPGVIFSLDFGGIVFLIGVKLLFAILGFLAGVALFVLGLSVSMLIATFTFPFTMHKINRKLKGDLPIEKADLE